VITRWTPYLPLLVFLFSLSARLGYWWDTTYHPDHGLLNPHHIAGQPIWDAEMHYRTADSLSRSEGFAWGGPGGRFSYPIALAGAFKLFGASLETGIAFNILCSSLASAMITYLGMVFFPPLIGVALGVAHSLSATSLCLDIGIMSEPLGCTLIVWQTIEAYLGLSRSQQPRIFLSGVLFGLSNVVRPMTLPMAPALSLTVFALQWRNQNSIRRALYGQVYYILGAMIVLGAVTFWMYRLYGVTTISFNSGSMLFCATSPDYPIWDGKCEDEARKIVGPSHKAVNDYLMKAAIENLKNDPMPYINKFVARVRTELGQLEAKLFPFFFFVLAAWIPSIRRDGIYLFIRRVVVLLLATSAPEAAILIAMILSLMFRRNDYLLLWTMTFLAGIIGIAFVNNNEFRHLILFDWSYLGLWYASIDRVSRVSPIGIFSRLRSSEKPADPTYTMQQDANVSPAFYRLAYGFATVAILMCAFIVISNILFKKKGMIYKYPTDTLSIVKAIETHDPHLLDRGDSRQESRLSLSPQEDPLFDPSRDFSHKVTSASHSRLVLLVGSLENRQTFIPANTASRGVEVARYLLPRDYDRTLLFFVAYGPVGSVGSFKLEVPGVVDRKWLHSDVCVVGRVYWDAYYTTIEAIAMFPWDPKTGEVNTNVAIWGDNAGHQKLLQKMTSVESEP